MSISKEIHELRTVSSPEDSRELQRKLAVAICRGWVVGADDALVTAFRADHWLDS